MRKLILIVLIAIALISCTKIEEERVNMLGEQINVVTEDGFKIEGTYYKGSQKGIILIHMLGRNRNEWNDFALRLQKEGYSIVAIDMRGHGNNQGNFKTFTSEDFNNIKKDVKAAKEFLASKGVTNFAIIGASIGANTALNYAVEDKSIRTIILLSPGLDYRGVKTDETIKQYDNSILIIASKEDSYSADSSEVLFSSAKGKKQIKIFQGLGHGTQMLVSQEAQTMILDWLRESLK